MSPLSGFTIPIEEGFHVLLKCPSAAISHEVIDKVLGNNVNLGAGTKMANLRFTGGDVPIRTKNSTIIKTGLRKLGAILGDNVQTGCNSVKNPGTLLGKKSMVMPNATVPSGYHSNSTLIRA